MMKFGILSSDFINYHESDDLSYENKKIIRHAKNIFSNCLVIDPTKIEVIFKNKKAKLLYFAENNSNDIEILNTLDVLLIRRTRNFSEQILDIISTIKKLEKKIYVYDNPESFIRPTSKIISLLDRLELFKQPESQIILNLNDNLTHIDISFPVIIKPTHGFKGRKIKICHNINEVNNFIKELKEYQLNEKEIHNLGYGAILQEFIKFDEEYRVNVLDGKSIGCVIKINDKEIKNADQGAIFAEKYNKQVIDLAEKVAKLHKLMFAGVDIGIKNNTLYLLECNRNPAFEAFDQALNQDSAKILIEKIYNEITSIKSNTKNRNEETSKKHPKTKEASLVFNQPIYGNIYLNSEHEQDGGHTYNQNQILDKALKDLVKFIQSSDIDEISKKDALSEIKDIEQLKEKKEKPEILSSIDRKIKTLNNIVEGSTKLSKSATPLIGMISSYFGF